MLCDSGEHLNCHPHLSVATQLSFVSSFPSFGNSYDELVYHNNWTSVMRTILEGASACRVEFESSLYDESLRWPPKIYFKSREVGRICSFSSSNTTPYYSDFWKESCRRHPDLLIPNPQFVANYVNSLNNGTMLRIINSWCWSDGEH
ncbi:hypothetical protein AB6A40_009818 [Gnathostoma spinigerum]|uniref:Uncharacterized protein n=1 Tax=Gnathostoma spinigerum TaxID=75299 RepID=A0ABD6EY81_9BILA